MREGSLPRAFVGNNLSDLARRVPEKVYEIINELAGNGDKIRIGLHTGRAGTWLKSTRKG